MHPTRPSQTQSEGSDNIFAEDSGGQCSQSASGGQKLPTIGHGVASFLQKNCL
jgi:hypothetical protein